MKINSLFFLIVLCTAIFCMNACVSKKAEIFSSGSNDTTQCMKISFEELTKSPEMYHLKQIEIEGYFVANYEDFSLYQSRFDSYQENKNNAIWVNFSKRLNLDENEKYKKIHQKNIRLKGTFNSHKKGHLNQYLGEIEDCYYISVNQ